MIDCCWYRRRHVDDSRFVQDDSRGFHEVTSIGNRQSYKIWRNETWKHPLVKDHRQWKMNALLNGWWEKGKKMGKKKGASKELTETVKYAVIVSYIQTYVLITYWRIIYKNVQEWLAVKQTESNHLATRIIKQKSRDKIRKIQRSDTMTNER